MGVQVIIKEKDLIKKGFKVGRVIVRDGFTYEEGGVEFEAPPFYMAEIITPKGVNIKLWLGPKQMVWCDADSNNKIYGLLHEYDVPYRVV